MARAKKHSVAWSVLYAIEDPKNPDDPYTGTWFAMGRTREEAAANFLKEKAFEHEFCGGIPAERYSIVHVVEGFSC